MLLILSALALGLVLGLVAGGSLRRLAEARFRWPGLAFVAVLLQFAPVPSMPGELDRSVAVGLLVASYVAVFAFVALNARKPGLLLIALGFALNLVVIVLNAGMPVGDEALREAFGEDYASERRELASGEDLKHRLEEPDDVALQLADVIPVPWFRQVVSVGDLVWIAGAVWLVAKLTARGEEADRGSSEASAGRPG